MSKKITIIVVIGIALLAFGLYMRSFFASPEVPIQEEIFSIEKSATLDLPTFVEAEKITVPNVFKGTENQTTPQLIKDETSGSTTATLRDNQTYSIYGFSGTDGSSFMLSLHDNNLRQARIDGEKDLISILGITEEQACSTGSITVTLESPYDEISSERYVGLSFCPNRIDLPETVELNLGTSTESNSIDAAQ